MANTRGSTDVLSDKVNLSPAKNSPLKTAPNKDVAMEIQDGAPQNTDENVKPATTTETPAKSPTKRVILSPTKKVKRSPTSGSPAKPTKGKVNPEDAAKVDGGDQEMATEGNISPRKRPAPPSDVTTEKADEEKEEEEEEDLAKRSRFVRRNSHVPDVPCFTSPVIWNMDVGTDATSMYVGEHRCIVGTADGAVLTLDLNGKPVRVQKLPLPIGSIIKDGDFLYAWCPNKYGFQKWKGALYDLTSELPRMQFEVEDIGECLVRSTMLDGLLVVGDDKGSLFMLGSDGEVIWRHEAAGEIASKLLVSDESGIYFGLRKKIAKVSWKDGSTIWEHTATGRFANVQNGVLDDDYLYVEVSGRIIQLAKEDGALVQEFVPARHRASGIAIGNGLLITGSCPTAIFDIKTAEEKYRMNFAGRLQDAVIQMHPNGRLYAAWDKVYCIDISEEALARAVTGRSTRTITMTLDGATCSHTANLIPMTTQSERGILVECTTRNGNVIVRTQADGYDNCWPVNVPVPYRIPGKKFMCDKLVANNKQMFYRPQGDIFELVTVEEMTEILNSQPKQEVLQASAGDENQNQLDEQIRQLKESHKNKRDAAKRKELNGETIGEENGDHEDENEAEGEAQK